MLDWVTVNSMLVSWIMRSIDPKVVASIPHHGEAKRLWDYLEKRFCVTNGSRLQQLRSAIMDCKQTKSMSIHDYYNKLIGLFDDLVRLKPLHTYECGLCTCDVSGKFATDWEEENFHQFLIVIDDNIYSTVRTRYHFLRNQVGKKEIELVYCRSENQVADILTKPLKLEAFIKLEHMMGMISLSNLD